MDSKYAKVCANYIEAGYPVVPIMPGRKCPGTWRAPFGWQPMPGWNNYFARMPSETEVETWMDWPGAGVGLMCGKLSGVVGVDFDIDVDGVHAEIEAALPVSPSKKRGSKGHTAFYRLGQGVESGKWMLDGKTVVEVLAEGRQTLMPPTLHPDGMEYVWIEGTEAIFDVEVDDIPYLEHAHVQEIERIIASRKSTTRLNAAPKTSDGDGVWRKVNEAALARLDEWVPDLFPAGQLRERDGGYRGKAFWRGGDGWNVGITADGIQDFAREGGLSAVDLVMRCKGINEFESHEWLSERLGIEDEDAPPVTVVTGGNLAQLFDEDEVEVRPEFPEDLLHAPGYLGELVAWINDTAIIPQPVLAVAASICAVGTALGQRVRGETDLRTNMLVIGTGSSGSGKDHARKCIKRLLEACGVQELHGGERIASSSGLFRSLVDSDGVKLFQLDEMGRMFGGLNSKRAAFHQADIPTMIMELFSSANSVYFGTEYADPAAHRKGQARATSGDVDRIEQPCLNIYGTTVPERFFDSLTSKEAVDGFLSRWLVFHAKEKGISWRKPARLDSDVPEHLVKGYQALMEMRKNPDPKGNLDGLTKPRPRAIPFTSAGMDVFMRFAGRVQRAYAKAKTQSDGTDVLWIRAMEHAAKLSLIASAGQEAIGKEQAEWATRVVEFCVTDLAMEVAARISDNPWEDKVKRVMRIIGNAYPKPMSGTVLWKRTKFLTSRERDDILKTLAGSSEIEVIEEQTGGRPRRLYRWVHSDSPKSQGLQGV